MKLNVKILLITTTSVCVVSAFMVYFLISSVFHTQLTREIEAGTKQYRLLLQNVETDLILQEGEIEQKLSSYRNEKWHFSLLDSQGNVQFQNMKFTVDGKELGQPALDQYAYQVIKQPDGYYLYSCVAS